METGVTNREQMEANMMRRLLPADQQCIVYGRQQIPIDRAEIECGIVLCGSGVGATILASDVLSGCAWCDCLSFLLWRRNQEYL